jgi:hypothetical protein
MEPWFGPLVCTGTPLDTRGRLALEASYLLETARQKERLGLPSIVRIMIDLTTWFYSRQPKALCCHARKR